MCYDRAVVFSHGVGHTTMLNRIALAYAACMLAALPAAHADGGGIFMRQLPGESLPAFMSAFNAAVTLAQSADGGTCVQLRISDADTTGALTALRFANGDELVRIDNEAVITVSAARGALQRKRPGDEVSFVLRGKGGPRMIALEILPLTAPTAPQPVSTVADTPPTPPAQRTPQPTADSAPGVIVIRAADLERELAQYDPFELVAAAELEMVRDNAGQVMGICSPKFGDISLSHMVGLRNGDVVLGVNGMRITSEEAIFEIAQRLEGESNFTAQLLRAGKPLVLRVRVQ